MGAKERAEEAPEERSPLAGACVLVVLGGVLVAIAFAIDEAVGVLLLVGAGMFALWRSARRVSDSSAPPPPRGVAPDSDEAARRKRAKARVALDPNGVMCIMHEPYAEPLTEEPEADTPRPKRPRLQDLVHRAFTARGEVSDR